MGKFVAQPQHITSEGAVFVFLPQPAESRRVLEQSIARDRIRPFVIPPSYHDVGCYLEAMQLGAVDYLEKPLSSVEIVRAVTTHLQPRHAAA